MRGSYDLGIGVSLEPSAACGTYPENLLRQSQSLSEVDQPDNRFCVAIQVPCLALNIDFDEYWLQKFVK